MGEAARVVVVGGGIWGCSIAYHLARAGVSDVVVLERHELASGNTSQAAGLVGQLRSSELMARSIMTVVGRLTRWEAEHREDSGFRQVGSLKLALTDARVRELKAQVAQARRWGLDVELISPKEAQTRVPFLETTGVKACAWIPTDGYAEPYTLAMALARAARRLGVRLRTQAPVTAITVRGGRVTGVETPDGPIASETVVVAAGPWVELIGAALGLRFDTIPIRHQLWVTAPMAEVPRGMPVVRVPDASVYMRPEVGGLLIGGFEGRPKSFPMAALPPTFMIEETEKDLGVLEELGAALTRAVPTLQAAPIIRGCAGLPTFTPDGDYLIGAVPRVRGLYIAAGCNAIGIAGSLLIGQWLSELILEGRTSVDTSTQALTRFGARYRSRRRLQADCESIYANFYSLDKGAF
ncbi:MAG: FAD-binding oxidoreductase [Candidatus Rokubacteria bacterium]|nr:FAD-binding oxidoreductase [Candidatus Rokubacteria bacterium]